MPLKSDNKKRLHSLIGKLIDTKQDKPVYLGGKLGVYRDGVRVVRVPGRTGYVYVRVGGNHSEIIEAVNGAVAEIFDLKVLITIPDSNPGVYVVVGRDLGQYSIWGGGGAGSGGGAGGGGGGAFLPLHGPSHSFGAGTDPTFVYKKQMVQPLQGHPTNPRSDHLYVEADFYTWKGEIKYFLGGNTVSLLPARPLSATQARYVTVYLDGNTNSLGIVTGSTFLIFPLEATGTVYNIPEVDPGTGIMLTAVLLTKTITEINWDDIRDVRSFLDAGGSTALPHALDPVGGMHTGSLPASYISVVDSHGHYTGTNAEQIFDEIWHTTNTGGVGSMSMHNLDPALGLHTGTLPATYVSITDTHNHYTGTNTEQLFDEVYHRYSGSVTIHQLDPSFGYHTGSLPATYISVIDSHNHYTGTNVEQVLDEIYHRSGTASSLGWFNVKDYGAIGNGIADDTASVTAAISAMNAVTGSVLYFPHGTYKTTGGFTLSVNCKVIGDGDYWDVSKIICTSATAVLFQVNSQIVNFQDLYLLNNHATPTAGNAINGLSSVDGQHINLLRMTIDGFYDCAVYLSGSNWVIDSCWIGNCRRYGLFISNFFNADQGDWSVINTIFTSAANNPTSAIRMISSGGGRIVNCKINSATAGFSMGVDLEISDTTTILLMTNNSFENVRDNAIKIINTSGDTFGHIVINGNQFGMYNNSTDPAIVLTAFAAGNLKDIVISDNVFYTPTPTPYVVEATNIDNLRIVDNVTDGYTNILSQTNCTNVVLDSSGVMATDTIWDARGDLAVGTGADTAIRLGVGTQGQSLTVNTGTASGLAWSSISGGVHNIISTTHSDANTGSVASEGRILVYHTGTWMAEDGIDISANDANITSVNFLVQTGTIPTPAVNHRLLFAKSNGIYTKDSAGSEVGPFGTGTSGGSGDVATDTIWDVKGDLAVGTGANTATRLASGAVGQILTPSTGTVSGLEWKDASLVLTTGTAFVGARYSFAGGTAPSLTEFFPRWGIKDYDTHNAVTTGTSTSVLANAWKFTAPMTGYYSIGAHIGFTSQSWDDLSYCELYLYKNADVPNFISLDLVVNETTNTRFLSANGIVVLRLVANDYITFAVWNASNATKTFQAASYNYMEIIKVGS